MELSIQNLQCFTLSQHLANTQASRQHPKYRPMQKTRGEPSFHRLQSNHFLVWVDKVLIVGYLSKATRILS
jgi:hypothetical protein